MYHSAESVQQGELSVEKGTEWDSFLQCDSLKHVELRVRDTYHR